MKRKTNGWAKSQEGWVSSCFLGFLPLWRCSERGCTHSVMMGNGTIPDSQLLVPRTPIVLLQTSVNLSLQDFCPSHRKDEHPCACYDQQTTASVPGERGPLSLERGTVCCEPQGWAGMGCGAVRAGRSEELAPLSPTDSSTSFEWWG